MLCVTQKILSFFDTKLRFALFLIRFAQPFLAKLKWTINS